MIGKLQTLETWQHGYIIANGIRLHYVTQGEGELMLMLHGFPEFWYSWRQQIPEFAKDHKVVAIDLRGYNDSDKPSDPKAYRMEELIKDVAEVIRGLGYDRCTL
ncbi:MAG: alpha/beta fold hydrolase, partial [Leptolyngbyaceae cyanobacterium CRU_2_3]|nr:alpha/beta fold hydrolase [Leptolyngbyaceae cyanobacterium CRU_2_3]